MADDRGRPVAFALAPGNVADITMALSLLCAVVPPKRLIADKAYDAHWGEFSQCEPMVRAVHP